MSALTDFVRQYLHTRWFIETSVIHPPSAHETIEIDGTASASKRTSRITDGNPKSFPAPSSTSLRCQWPDFLKRDGAEGHTLGNVAGDAEVQGAVEVRLSFESG